MKKASQSDYKSVCSPLAERLTELMKVNDKKQADIAELLDVTRQSVSQYCGGASLPPVDKLVILADYFDVSTDYLLGRTDIKTTDTTVKDICAYTGLSEEAINEILFVKEVKKDPECMELLSDVIASEDFYNVLDCIYKFYESLYLIEPSTNDGFAIPIHSMAFGLGSIKDSIKQFANTFNIDFNSFLLVAGKEALKYIRDDMTNKFAKFVVKLYKNKYKEIYEQRYMTTDDILQEFFE